MTKHKLQAIKDQHGEYRKYFLTLPKAIVEGLEWKKGTPINISLTTQYSDIKLLLEKAKE